MPLADPNSLNVAIGTTYDGSGVTAGVADAGKYSSQIEIAKQKVLEFSQAEGVSSSATVALNNEITKASTAVENHAAKIQLLDQKILESSKSDGAKQSTTMSLINQQAQAVQKYDEAIQKQDQVIRKHVEEAQSTNEAANSNRGLAGSLVAAEVAYQVLQGALQRSVDFFKSAIDSANNYQRAIAGLNSTSRAMGDNVSQATQAAQKLSSDGLIPVTQSATALRNLLAAGFSLPQAIQLMDALKDKMAFNRQGYDNMGEAVVHATKGIELGNTRMLEATGVNEKMNAMLKEAGVSTNALGNLQSSAAARQAIVNGVLKNAVGNYGDAAKASEVFGAKQAAAGTAIENLKISLGGIEQLIGGPLIQGFTSFLNTNQRMIIDFGVAAVAAGAVSLALFGVVKAIQAFSLQSLIAVATNPLLLMLTAVAVLAGVVVYNAIDKMQSKVKEMNSHLGAGADNTNGLTDSTNELTAAQQSLADKLQKVDEQIAKSNRDYQESLAKAIQGVQDKVANLNEQLAQENDSFAKSEAKKLDQFNKTQTSMADAHDKRVDSIQKQLDKERALGKWADQQKMADLQQQLDDENKQYNQQLADKQSTYNQDVANAKQSHDEKVADLQKQLDKENGVLKKHAADVAAVRNVMMLDEIDKIKQTHNDQIAALDDQKQKAVQSAQQTVAGTNNAYTSGLSGAQGGMSTIGSTLGSSMGSAFKNALVSSLSDAVKGIGNWFKEVNKALTLWQDSKFTMAWGKAWDMATGKISGSGNQAGNAPTFASGGPVQAGQPIIVGDNPDGSINSTTEMFVPSQSGTIIPAGQTRSLLGSTAGGGGVTIHQTNHIYNQIDMDAANIELGYRLRMA